MTAASRRLSDGPVELIISWLLRVGVWSSIAIIAFGLVLLLAKDREALLHRQAGGLNALLKHGLPGQPGTLSSYGDVLLSVRHGEAFGVIMLGLMVLLLTPVMRVAVSIVAFLLDHDRLYALITLIVLLLLMTGILLGNAGG
jgi:uncharacterized membrane protein